ncbi:MAG: energy transducer TonB [bacterium]
MKKYYTVLILVLILIFSTVLSSFAEERSLDLYLTNVSKQQVIDQLNSFIVNNKYILESVNKDKTVYSISVKYKEIAGNPDYIQPENKLILNIDESGNGVELHLIKNSTSTFEKTSGYLAGMLFFNELKKTYSDNYSSDKTKLSEMTPQEKALFEFIKNKVINDVGIKQINLTYYSKTDPDFVENQDLIKNNIHKKGNKKLNYSLDKDRSSYSVLIKNKELFYDINGNLKRITVTDNNNYPEVTYKYNYPDGGLTRFKIDLSEQHSYQFDSLGNEIKIDFGLYMRGLQDRIKYNWNPPKLDKSIRVVTFFKIAKNGKLISYKIIKGSDNYLSNEAVVNAIIKSAPFPPLPQQYDEEDIDIQFTFDYNVFGKNK